jgi:hypothetical protein
MCRAEDYYINDDCSQFVAPSQLETLAKGVERAWYAWLPEVVSVQITVDVGLCLYPSIFFEMLLFDMTHF